MLSAVAFFIGGILLHRALPVHPLIFLITAIGFAIVAWLWSDWPIANLPLAMSIVCVAITAAQLEAFYFQASEINAYATDQPRLARVELVLDHPLRIIGAQFNTARPMPPRQVTTASVQRVLTQTGWRDASGEMLLQIDPPDDRLQLGQRIRVFGMLQRPSPAMNPGQFDWAGYYRDQRVLTSMQVQSDVIEMLGEQHVSPLAHLREWVRALLARGFTKEQSLDQALLRAIVLGDHDPEMRDVQDQFRKTGTSHHLVVSGMHVAILGAVIFAICRLLRLRPRVAATVGFASVMFYAIVALPSAPVGRALAMCAALYIGIMFRRSIDKIHLLAMGALAILLYHPLDLFTSGFQLSFVVVLGLMILFARIARMLDNEHERVAVEASREGRVSRWLIARYRLRRHVGPMVIGAVLAWAISMPLVAFYFEQLNPWQVFASLLLFVPAVVTLIAGFLKIALTALLPFGATWWAALAALPVSFMRHAVGALSRLPGSDVPLPAHSVLLILIYYALLCLPLLMVRCRPVLKRSSCAGPIGALLLLLSLPFTGATHIGDGTLRVHVMAIGAGQCVLIETPNNRAILFDAGSATLTDPIHKCIGPFLRHVGRASIDEIWLSHGDFDHVSAAADVVRTYGVHSVRYSTEFEHLSDTNPPDEALLELLHAEHIEAKRISRGEKIDLGGGVTIDVLWPPRGSQFNSNESGLVLRLTYARRTIIFPADIQQRAESELLKHANELHCDVLIAPHHGSFERTTPAFIAAADPLYIVSSCDRTLSSKQRQFDRQFAGRTLLRTSQCGAITIQIDKTGGLTVTPFLQAK